MLFLYYRAKYFSNFPLIYEVQKSSSTRKIPLLVGVQFFFFLFFLFSFLRTVLFCLLCTVFSAFVYCNFLSPVMGIFCCIISCTVFYKGWVVWRGEDFEAKMKACFLSKKAGVSVTFYRSPSCTIRLYKTLICLMRM